MKEEEKNKRSVIFCTIIHDNWTNFAVFQLEGLESYSEAMLVYLIRFQLSPLHKIIESLSGVTLRDRIKSEEIRKKWKVEVMIDDIQNYQLKWNQQDLRMPENILPRKALQYRPQGKGI